jgi:ubiquinone/menaquinone biosynthesis C-methylase UbiE
MTTNTNPDPAPDILPVSRTKKQAQAFYNRISRVYDLLARRSEVPMQNAGLDLLKAVPGEKVFEIGFGTGHCLIALARAVGPTGTVHGVDLADRMVQQTTRNLAAAGLLGRCDLRCGDASQLPFAEESMDAVFMSFALELFDTPEIPQVLRECRRVLRTGGRIVVVGMSREGPGELLVRVFEWMHLVFPMFVDCRPIYVRRALEAAGFQIKDALRKRMWIPVEIILGTKLGLGALPAVTYRAACRAAP